MSLIPSNVQDKIIEAMNVWKVPACVIVAFREGSDTDQPEKVVLCYGKDKAGQPIHDQTRFPLSSNTKLFTNMALGHAFRSKGVDWDTPVKEILPDFKGYNDEYTNTWTPKLLASHTSGLPRYDQVIRPELKIDGLYEAFKLLPPVAKPGEQYQYCNLTYTILAKIIEKLSGKSFYEYLKGVIFEPLKMDSTSFDKGNIGISGYMTYPDDKGERQVKEVPYYLDNCRAWDPALGLFTTATDLLKWVEALPSFPDYPLACSSIAIEHVEANDYPNLKEICSYGLGLTQADREGSIIHEHTGDSSGFNSMVVDCPELKIRYGMMCNAIPYVGGCGFRDWLRNTLLDHLTGDDSIDWFKTILDKEKEIAHKPSPSIPATGDQKIIDVVWDNKLYADQKPVLASMGENKFEGCFEVRHWKGGKIEYDTPFQVEMLEDGEKLKVTGITGVGLGLKEADHPMIFVREHAA
ncbi:uncharacterized protein L199_007803 [Kwoniella botswanensis]|uniref:uncharacterized protein n=1 Tax=Kwoniella botswanensis TaxID=1268659 RepID=UPI00315D4E66